MLTSDTMKCEPIRAAKKTLLNDVTALVIHMMMHHLASSALSVPQNF